MFSPLKFFNPPYLFDLKPYTYPQTINIMIGFFSLLVVIAIIIKVYQSFKKLPKSEIKLFNSYFSFLMTLGFLGLVLTWFRYERISLLAGRFWLIVWLIIGGFWLYKILKYQFKTLPEIRLLAENKKLLQKYLPKKH